MTSVTFSREMMHRAFSSSICSLLKFAYHDTAFSICSHTCTIVCKLSFNSCDKFQFQVFSHLILEINLEVK